MKLITQKHEGRQSRPARKNALASRKGFTLVETVLTGALIGLLVAVAIPVLSGIFEEMKGHTDSGQARQLQQAVQLYKMKKKTNVTGTAAKPMTVTRANEIYAEIDGDLGGGFKIVEQGFQLSTNATFPSGWGETTTGVFDPIP